MALVVPAVLPYTHEEFTENVYRFARIPSVSRVQIDVVDGRFASPMSWPYTSPEEIRSMVERGAMLPYLDRVTYEIDLMCLDPERASDTWLALGASRLTFHAETFVDIAKSLAQVRKRFGDMSATFGLAVNVTTDIALIEPYLEQVEYVQFMGIASIGKQGQLFDKRVLQTIGTFRKAHPTMPIQVDGGVTLSVARELVALGVSNLIVGSALMRAADVPSEIEKFEALQTPFGV